MKRVFNIFSLAVILSLMVNLVGMPVRTARAADWTQIQPLLPSFSEKQKLTASDGAANDYLGGAMALSADGTTLVVGAPQKSALRGAAYVFTRSGSTWSQAAKLTATTPFNYYMGTSVAVSGDGSVIVVGAPRGSGSQVPGQVYVFVRPGGGWAGGTQTATLRASDGVARDWLGNSISVSPDGSVIVAGSPGDGFIPGAAYVFVKPVGGWATGTQTAKLTGSDAVNNDRVGQSVALSGDGNTIVAVASVSNRVYVFTKPGGGWVNGTQTAKLTPSDSPSSFGDSTAVNADSGIIVVGAIQAWSGNPGLVYVFAKPGGGWADGNETSKLTASDGAAGNGAGGNMLGAAVSITSDGATIVAGAWGANSNQGAAYIFAKPGGGWATGTETTKLTASDGAANDYLGGSVAISSDGATLIAGAFGDNSFRGAAYVYLPSYTVTFHGNGNTGGSMSPQTASASTSLTSNAFTRTGYTFAGWDTSSAGTTVVYADGATYDFSADIDLYAVWTALPTHTATFHGNGNDGGSMSPQSANTSTSLDLNAFTLTGYNFAGWDTDPAGATVVYTNGATYDFSADIDLYAVWTVACSSPVTVVNANDTGAGSLRQALADVCDGGTIDFDNNYTITLASQLMVDKAVTINGNGAANTIIQANENPNTATYRVLEVAGTGNLTLNGMTVQNGQCTTGCNSWGDSGGGIINFGTLTVINSAFSGNSASFGGGVVNPGTMTVTNSAFSGNSATTDDGGGILNIATLTVTNSTFTGNTAGNVGSALSNYGAGNAAISNSTFSGNTGNGTIRNDGTMTMLNSTLAANPNGIVNFGMLDLKNTILANKGDCANYGTLTASNNNLIQNAGSACGLVNGTNGNIIGVSPLISTLGDYGGLTQTFALLPGSPAIDAGDSATCAAATVNNMDQRGVTRPAACDIGAFESQGFTLTYESGDAQSSTVNTDFADPLVVIISSAFGEPVDDGEVTFTAPGSGASATFVSNPISISIGSVSAAATANDNVGGPYTVTASANGAAAGVDFSLTNTAPIHTVTFHANGGSGSMTPQTANASALLTTNAFTYTGYTFAGWDTSSAGTTVVYADEASYAFSADIDLYAVWTAIPAPEAFTKTGLADGSILKGTSVDLTWTASAGAVTYEYCMDETPGNTCTTAWAGMGNVLTLNRGALSPNSTFYWQIRAVNGSLTKTEADGGTWWSFTLDNTAPQLSLPSDFNLEADTLGGRNVIFSASATDIVDGSVAVSCDANSGDLFPVGVTTVNCSATDTANNTANGSFSVTITDTTGPQLSLPSDINLEADTLGGRNVIFSASATDLVDGSVTIICDANSGNLFPVGVTTVNCSATDKAKNPVNGSFTVTITDTTDPQLSLPSDINLEANTLGGRNVTFSASATDLVDGSLKISCDANSGNHFPVGVTTVNCSATDKANNTANGSFTVTITDTTDPQLSLPANITTNSTSAAGAVVTFSASATDIVDGSVAVSCTPASGSTFPVGVTTVDCSANDTAGNTGTGSFTVTVQDAIAPTVVSSVLVNPSPTALSSVDFTVTFSESVTGVDMSGPTFDDFNLATSGAISGAAVSGVSGTGSVYIVTVNTGSGNGTIRLNVGTGGSIVDGAGNPLSASFVTGQTYSVVKAPTFTDIDPAYWAYTYIERLYMAGITNGCTTVPQAYCPNSATTRAQLAVMILRGKYGAEYVPPSVGGSTGFNDVAPSYWAAAWIKQLAAEGISSGCGGGNFCPDSPVTRAQVAIMLVRATHENGFVPQTATGVFNDVAVGSFGADYIEQLWADGVTSGCGGGNFCPSVIVKRDQIAVFLVKAFHLP